MNRQTRRGAVLGYAEHVDVPLAVTGSPLPIGLSQGEWNCTCRGDSRIARKIANAGAGEHCSPLQRINQTPRSFIVIPSERLQNTGGETPPLQGAVRTSQGDVVGDGPRTSRLNTFQYIVDCGASRRRPLRGAVRTMRDE